MSNVVPVVPPVSVSSGSSILTINCAPTIQSKIGEGGSQTDTESVMKKPKRRSRKRSNPASSSCYSVVSDTTAKTTANGAFSTASNHDNAETLSLGDTATTPVSEDESDAQRRRRDRNLREQERSQRIATQIADLKDILSQSNVAFKPDKYSTLVSVHNYILSLQERVKSLDKEHKGLLSTIAGAGEIVNRGVVGVGSSAKDQVTANQVGSSSIHPVENSSSREATEGNYGMGEDDRVGEYDIGLDYKSFFHKCTVALCVTSIDGRLIECNNEFVHFCGISKEVLEASGLRSLKQQFPNPALKREENEHSSSSTGNTSVSASCEKMTSKDVTGLSLFNLLSRSDMSVVFEAMSTMLTSHSSDVNKQSRAGSPLVNHWTGTVDNFSQLQRKVRINISLVRHKCNKPKYFNCAVTPRA